MKNYAACKESVHAACFFMLFNKPAHKKLLPLPKHLLHSIKSILCYEEEGPVSYEWDGHWIQQNSYFFYVNW